MQFNAGVYIHNKFDIEKRDCRTGELKQQITVYNIIKDSLWDRLLNFQNYFSSIHFGTGSGTPSKSGNTLFNWLGQKTAANDTLIKAIPQAMWKRKIVLNPEEYVNKNLTEVGIGYSTAANSIVTHAMLKDSEGNQISMPKADVDVVTIYASVFATFSTQNADRIKFVGMPDNNALVNYLIGGASWTSSAFYTGESDIDTTVSGLISERNLGSTASISAGNWIKNEQNKSVKTPSLRLGTPTGNGDIMEVGFGPDPTKPIFRSVLPIAGIFGGKQYETVPVGVGDGQKNKFILPSKNIRLSSIVIKEDGVIKSEATYEKSRINKSINYKLRNLLDISPAGSGNAVTLSDDGLLMAVAHSGDPYVSTYDWNGSAWIKRPNPVDKPGSNCNGVSLSDDGLLMAVAHVGDPYVSTYDWIGNAWVKRPNPASSIGNRAFDVKLSLKGSLMAIAHDSIPYVSTYDWISNAWVKRPNPVDRPAGIGTGIHITSDGLFMAVSHNENPYVSTYDWTGSAWVKRPNPVDKPAGNGNAVALSDDGLLMAVAHNESPYVSTYDWNGNAWIKRPNPVDKPGNTCLSVSFQSKDVLWVGEWNSPFLNVYDWDGVAWIRRSNPYNLPSGMVNGIQIKQDGTLSFLAHNELPYITIYDIQPRNTLIDMQSAVGNNKTITANYITEGIHKTEQYVIDFSVALQYGEGV